MATDAKEKLDNVLSKFGISAFVSNKVRASLNPDLQSPATISFGLKIDGSYSDISVSLSNNNLSNLVNQINLLSEKTGIVAALTNSNSEFTLEHTNGDEIVISDFEITGSAAPENGSLYLQKLATSGAPIHNAYNFLRNGDSTRISGEIMLQSSASSSSNMHNKI